MIRLGMNRLAMQSFVLDASGDRLNGSHRAPWKTYKGHSDPLKVYT